MRDGFHIITLAGLEGLWIIRKQHSRCWNVQENLVSAAHCATRLRMVIADNGKCSKEKLEQIDGVKGVFEASGQLQVIFGTGVVNKVFEEFAPLAGIDVASTKEDVKKAAASKQNWFFRCLPIALQNPAKQFFFLLIT